MVEIRLELNSAMKKILIITSDLAKYKKLDRLFSDNNTKTMVHEYSELSFAINGKNSRITLYPDNEDIRNFSKIIILSTPEHSKNHIFSALACYCHRCNIPMFDDSFTNISGKLYALWRFWEKGIPTAKTFFGPRDFMIQGLSEINGSGILKSIYGSKGRDNYLVNSDQELVDILRENPDVPFILQNYIPNDGDWRIILINFEPKLAIYRSSHGKDYRNNTSVGGEAKLVPLENVDPKIIELSVAAAKALDIKIAGADIVQDSKTGEYTVLEVNRTPQLATGAFTDEKQKVIQHLIHS